MKKGIISLLILFLVLIAIVGCQPERVVDIEIEAENITNIEEIDIENNDELGDISLNKELYELVEYHIDLTFNLNILRSEIEKLSSDDNAEKELITLKKEYDILTNYISDIEIQKSEIAEQLNLPFN